MSPFILSNDSVQCSLTRLLVSVTHCLLYVRVCVRVCVCVLVSCHMSRYSAQLCVKVVIFFMCLNSKPFTRKLCENVNVRVGVASECDV